MLHREELVVIEEGERNNMVELRLQLNIRGDACGAEDGDAYSLLPTRIILRGGIRINGSRNPNDLTFA